MLQRRGSGLLLRSDAARFDIGGSSGRRPKSSGGSEGAGKSSDKLGAVSLTSESGSASTTTSKHEGDTSSGKGHRWFGQKGLGGLKSASIGASTSKSGGTGGIGPGLCDGEPDEDSQGNTSVAAAGTTTAPPQTGNDAGSGQATTADSLAVQTATSVGSDAATPTAGAAGAATGGSVGAPSVEVQTGTGNARAVSKTATSSSREEKSNVKDDGDYDGDEEDDNFEVTASAPPATRGLAVGGAAVAGTAAGARGRQRGEEGGGSDTKEKTAATRIGEKLGQMPLSKIKIVIGGSLWQRGVAYHVFRWVGFFKRSCIRTCRLKSCNGFFVFVCGSSFHRFCCVFGIF